MTDFNHSADLQSLRAAIAASPIVAVAPVVVTASKPPDFAEWCRRQPADIDTVILDWLRSQVQQPRALS